MGSRRSARLTLSVAFGCVLVVGVFGASPSPGASLRGGSVKRVAEAAPVPAGAQLPTGAVELIGERTRTTRTYALQNGTFTQVAAQQSLNYRDTQGVWQPIDDTLRPAAGGGYVNAANSYRAHLPADLTSPVRFDKDGAWVSFSLVGAHGAASVSGNQAKFNDVLPGVSVSYAAAADLLKESLVLADAKAQRSFVFDLKLSPGLTPRTNAHGGIDFVNAAGKIGFSFLPPSMQDSSGTPSGFSSAVTLKLSSTAAGYRVTLTPDAGWLASPERKWPVTIDPSTGTVYLDCTLASGYPLSQNCPTSYLVVGQDTSGAWRTLDPWTLSNYPPNVKVLNADFAMYAYARSNTTPFSVSVYQQTRVHNQYASWNLYDGTNPWTTPGGDFVSTADDTTANVGAAINAWVHFYPTKLVQGWLDGTIPNDGMVLKASSEPAPNWAEFYSAEAANGLTPTLSINYSPRTGEPRQFGFQREQLSDRISADVNVANGNLVLDEHDLAIPGTGLDLGIDRFHNSLAANAFSDTGNGFVYIYGTSNQVTFTADGSAFLFGPSDEPLLFQKNSDGSFSAPTAIDASFIKSGDGSYTLTMHASGVKWNFNSSGYLTSQVDRNGNTISYSEVACGSRSCVGTITDTQGRTFTISYDTNGHATRATDASGRTWQFTYNASGQLASYTDPAGKITSFGYDANSNMTSLTDPLGNITSFAYDSWRRLTSITRPGSITTSYSYNAADSSCPSGSTGKTIGTDPNGHTTSYCFDSELRVTKTTDAKGNSASTIYNSDSNPLTQTDALGHTTSFGYDSTNENQLWSQSPLEGTSNRTTFAYTNTSHPFYPTGYTNPQSHSWSYGYDENTGNTNGNLTSQTPSGQLPVKFTYNANGTVATATDPNGNATSYGYDTKGNLTSITPPSPLGAVSISYDSLSRIHTITDGKGQTRTYTYDPLDRVTQIAYTNGSTLTANYDANGNLTAQSDPSGSYSYSYDPLNRLTQQTQPQGTVSYVYDPNSNLTTLTDANGTTTYGYDADNLLSSLREPGAANPITFQYDANENRTEIDYPNGISEYVSYDNSQRLSSIVAKKPASGTILTSFSYSYANGSGADTSLRQSLTYQYPGDSSGTTVNYGYDTLDRLTSASGGGHSYSYSYGPNGNMTSKTIDGTQTTYNYNAANQVTNSGYTYDTNGSQTADPGIFTSATYNPLDQASSITPTGGAAISLGYHGLGQAHRISAGAVTYTNDILGLNNETGSPQTFYTRDTGGTILGERRNGSSYYFLFDGIGSVVAATDSTGAVIDSFKYDPYGNITSTSGTLYEPIRFTGGYSDGANGSGENLYKFGERYYDPTLGRWTQQDPIDNPLDLQGWNQYKYAGDNPVNATDLSGDATVSPCAVGNHRFIVNGKNMCVQGGNILGHLLGKAWCAIKRHPVLAVVGGLTVLAGGGLIALGVGIGTGALAAGEGATTFAEMEAEFGAEHSGALVGIAGGGVAVTGGVLAKRAGC